MVGLYARAQDRYITSRDPAGRGTHTVNRGLFYWVGPENCSQRDGDGSPRAFNTHGVEETSVLCLLHNRFCSESNVRCRCVTTIHVGLNKPQNNDTADQVLASTDVVLLLLMGAADATARVAHTTLGLTTSPHDSGWQRQRWMKEVSQRLARRSESSSSQGQSIRTRSRSFVSYETRSMARRSSHSLSVCLTPRTHLVGLQPRRNESHRRDPGTRRR